MKLALNRDLRLFLVALGAVFVAELGDKTQLTALAFSADAPGYRWIVFAASAGALVATSLIGVLVGDLVARLVKPRVINVAAGLIFLGCAALFVVRFLTAGGASAAGAERVAEGRTPWESFVFTFVAIFVAELGDKTQLATLSLAAGNRHARWMVFLGASSALVLTSALACLVGGLVGSQFSSRYVGLAAAAVFAVLGGFFLMGRAEKGTREFAWLVGEIERVYADASCRECGRFMRFLEHVRALDSEVVSRKVDELLLPRDRWRPGPCDRRCPIDLLHERWHEKLDHADASPLEKG